MRIYRFILLGIAGVLACACAKEKDFIPSESGDSLIPLNIDGSIVQVPTKATAAGFVDNDAVGLFAVNYSDNNTVAGTLALTGNQADNVKYIFDEGNQKWNPVKPVYYKNINTNVDLYLYYPFFPEISDINAANFEVRKDQSSAATSTSLAGYEASDWMWGKTAEVMPTESRVHIALSHRLAAIQLTLEEGSGFDPDEFEAVAKSVILTGTTRKAALDFSTGVATPIGSAQLDGIVMCPQTDGSFRAIVVPQSFGSGNQLFAITLDGVSYSYVQSTAVAFQQGKQTNYAITINKRTPSGDYELELSSTEIVDWKEDLNSHGGEARQYYVVNLSEAGTLQAAIEADNKNPAKIKNLKVVGPINNIDFAFMNYEMTILEAINLRESQADGGIIPSYAFRDKKSLVYFVFPEDINTIREQAFYRTNLSGPLYLPDQVTVISSYAFSETNISSIQFPASLKTIGERAFAKCKGLNGSLLIPDGLTGIYGYAFYECGGLGGHLHLPSDLESLGQSAFYGAGEFSGDLTIPEKLKSIGANAFSGCGFSGHLDLGNVETIGAGAFEACGFVGDLVIPEGVIEVPNDVFWRNDFSSVILPSSLKTIGEEAFYGCTFTEPLVFPEGLVAIQNSAFSGCSHIPSIVLPASIQTLGYGVFKNCFGISSIVCNATEPPYTKSDSFSGVAKDNFAVEVPHQSVASYQTDAIWGEFTRITAHQDFYLSRSKMRALNEAQSRTYVLRAPAGFAWSVDGDSLPDWITVSPSSGVGKTDVTISVSEMARTNDTFEINEGSYNNPSYVNYKGRAGEVVFNLDDKNYDFVFTVEQYDCDDTDGKVLTLQTASQGTGIDIVFTGDGYDAKDIVNELFVNSAAAAYEHLFDLEPFNTYKQYFNVFAVTAKSDDSGMGTVNTIRESKFSTAGECRTDEVFAWARKADASMDFSKSQVVLLLNDSGFRSNTYLYGDGSVLSCCTTTSGSYPYDFRGLIQHEVGGHGFGKLGDEEIRHNAYIQTCACIDNCDHGEFFNQMKEKGWYKNLSMTSDPNLVPWSHLIYHSQYSDYVDVYEGGYMHSRGVYRSEATSCMNNNIPYYSAISRQAIVERIMECAGESFSLEDFYANDSNAIGTKSPLTESKPNSWQFDVNPSFNQASGHGPVYMGEHPNVK